MRITIINGSPRSNGATGKILLKMKEILEKKEDTDINFINLNKYSMKFCTGCYQCFKKRDGCIIKDDGIEDLSKLIEKSDALIIGSPTYASNVTAQLKNLIDRGHFVLEQLLDNKYCFTVATYVNQGINGAIKVLNDLFIFSGGILSGKFKQKINFNIDPFEDKLKENELINKTEKFYKNIKIKRKRTLLNNLVIKMIRNIGIKPILKHDDHKGLKYIWQKKGYI